MSQDDDIYDYVRSRSPRRRRPAGPLIGEAREAALQADAAVRAAADTLTFGAINPFAAAADATFALAPIGEWGNRFDANLAEENAIDHYNQAHRSAATKIGQVAALALALRAEGPLNGVLAARRLAGVAPITAREGASVLAAGGAAGAASQAVGDVLARKTSSPGDYLGATIGGAAGVSALPLKPARAAAVNGAVTSAAQDVFNGRTPSIERAAQSASAARMAGGAANYKAMNWASALPRRAKGELGEAMGTIRSIADWKPRDAVGKTAAEIAGTTKRWFPDGRRGLDLFLEDKFGPFAQLSKNQILAQKQLAEKFQLNHFLPRDVGKSASALGATVGGGFGRATNSETQFHKVKPKP